MEDLINQEWRATWLFLENEPQQSAVIAQERPLDASKRGWGQTMIAICETYEIAKHIAELHNEGMRARC